jgi:hypothetical protein
MECPFCAEEVKDDAIVCKHCGRDLKIPKPLIEENAELVAKIGELQRELDQLRAEVDRRRNPGGFWGKYFAAYVVPPILLLLAAHVLLIVTFDVNPLFMRFVSMLIPLPFGFCMAWISHLGWRTALGLGAIVGVVAVAGMTAIIGYIDEIPVMPQNLREWRETAEYATSITLATLTGYLLSVLVRNILHQHALGRVRPNATAFRIAAMVGPNVGRVAMRRRAERIVNLMKITKSVGTTLGSATGMVYTGIRVFLASTS